MKITIEQLDFPLCIKEKIEKYTNKDVDVEYTNGKIINFEKTNISLIEPNKIIFSKNNYYFLLLFYSGNELYFNDLSQPIKITRIVDIIRNKL